MTVESKKVAAIIIAIGTYLKQESKKTLQGSGRETGTTGNKR